MPTSAAQAKATEKYKKKAYDRILVMLSKGDKDVIKEHATERGESVNRFIKRAIAAQILRDRKRAREAAERDDEETQPV